MRIQTKRRYPKKSVRQNAGITCSHRCDSANQSENAEREDELQLGGMAGDRDLRSRNGRMARRGSVRQIFIGHG